MWQKLKRDLLAVKERDPACRNLLEAALLYPGFHAIAMHRVAHVLWRLRLRFLARLLSHLSRFFTGVEIHPAAHIGAGFFIDHGMGVVIGETAEIGEDVTMYQGVTLGGTGKERGKRHPTIGNRVVIGADAVVLGSFKVGDGARIGAGAVVVKSVPPHATIVGVPGRVVKENGVRKEEEVNLDHADLPDPLENIIRHLLSRIDKLEKQLASLEERKRSEIHDANRAL
ncbi:MAG TPA: serine O-acetyltransferase [Firmicutes bacterium]|nr:serine O-acetyltransferase [Bacillota bacterium]